MVDVIHFIKQEKQHTVPCSIESDETILYDDPGSQIVIKFVNMRVLVVHQYGQIHALSL